MEDEYGRARVFLQYGDQEDIIEEAIMTCPVDCIHYVPWEELIQLEKGREGQVINFKARLVGNEGLLSNNGRIEGSARISSDSAMRCNNCPSRGCANCPMCVRQRDAACNLRHSPHTHKWSRPLFLRTAHICVAQVWGRRQPGVRQKENEEGEGSKGKSPETGTGRNDEGRRPLDAPLVARLHHQMLHIS